MVATGAKRIDLDSQLRNVEQAWLEEISRLFAWHCIKLTERITQP
jgi:hypothetical protein